MNSAYDYAEVTTPIGALLAIADEHHLYFLQFFNNELEKRKLLTHFHKKYDEYPVKQMNGIIDQTRYELAHYFNGRLKKLTISTKTHGTFFQTKNWQYLEAIPYGKTISYQQLAKNMNNKKACRAVALANKANNTSIIIPCHRVINKDKSLGGYQAGIDRKLWLIQHEQKINQL